MYITAENHTKPSYKPGLNRWTLYKDIWIKHWKGFQEIYDDRFKNIYGPLSKKKKREVEKLIGCGSFKNGFQVHTCDECGLKLVVPFTCKSRLCLSCYRKKLFGWSVNLSYILNTSLAHTHITFTLPGRLTRMLHENNCDPVFLMKIASLLYQREMLLHSGRTRKSYLSAGIMATLHKSGNGLNVNPHVHLIGTRELVNRKTGEIKRVPFIKYHRMKIEWMKAVCRQLVRLKLITQEESRKIRNRYKNGFHVYFQPIDGDNNEVLFRTSEYLATGFFHNSQILKIDHKKKEVTFKYRSWVDRHTMKKSYKIRTLDIYEFMARMLFFLPDHHQKMIRYYGIYAQSRREKLAIIEKCKWNAAIEHSFNKDPVICPDCGSLMTETVVYSNTADFVIKRITRTHILVEGYFRKIRGP